MGSASDASLTRIRAQEIGFVFQQFNLIPTLTADGERGHRHDPPRPLQGRSAGSARRSCWTASGSGDDWTICRRGCRVASSSAWPSPAPWPTGPG